MKKRTSLEKSFAGRLLVPRCLSGILLNERGTTFALLMMVIILLTVIGMVTAAIMSLDSDQARQQAANVGQGNVVDAGAEYATAKLAADYSWGGLPAPGKAVGNGSFYIPPPSTLDDDGSALPSGQKRVVVTATVQSVTKSYSFKLGVIGYGAYIQTASTLTADSHEHGEEHEGHGSNSAEIDGNMYVGGNVDDNSITIDGSFYVPSGHSGGEIYPDPQPVFPALPDTSSFERRLRIAAKKSHNDYTLDNGDDLSLKTRADSTLYVNGDFEAEGNNTITGPGRIVVYGKIDFGNNTTIGNLVTIISSDDLKMEGANTTCWTDSSDARNTMYSRQEVKFEKGTARGTLLGIQGVEVSSNAILRGKAFTYGELTLDSATIYGFIAGRTVHNNLISDCEFHLATGYFTSLPPVRIAGSFREL